MKIIGGPASQLLASRVARNLGKNPSLCDFNRFPDGEVYTRIQDEPLEDVTIIQSTTTDSDLVYLLQMIDACEDASRINVVIPYMGYARQDKKFKTGEPISARAVAKTINADTIFTVNIHEKNILDYFNAPAFDLDATKFIGSHLRSLELENPLIVAPDVSAVPLAQSAASDLGMECDHLEKTRLSGDTVSIKTKNMDVTDRNVVLIDDMIATGGTMAESIKLLKDQGAKDVYLACIHPVLTRNAVLRLFNAGVRDIFATDTIEKAQSCVSAAPLIADAIRNL